MPLDTRDDATPHHAIPLSDAVRAWTRVAALSFGGPAGQIAVMHRILVDEKRWIGEGRFLNALNFCMLLPGPEAQQLATYLGWLLHRTAGGIIAGALFILPGFLSILALSLIYVVWGAVPLVEGLFFGLKAAVLAIVIQAVVRIGARALTTRPAMLTAAAAFVLIFAFGAPFPLIVAGAGLVGWLSRGRGWFGGGGHGGAKDGLADADSALGAGIPAHATRGGLALPLAILALWLLPVALLLLAAGPEATFTRLALFFSQMAVVTFGGAYAVLAYVAQAAVETWGWMTPEEMLDGLGLAETTPGPLIQVVQFVGFLAAFRDPGALNPYVAAVLASILVTWVTFLPSFLWIFLGAPHIERLRGNRALASALSAITAAVVGVILNLALWFAIHTLFAEQRRISAGPLSLEVPVPASLDPAAAVLAAGAALALFRFRLGALPVLAAAALAGAMWVALI